MSETIIEFNKANLSFELKHKTKLRAWIEETIKMEGFNLEHLSYVFCDDKYLLKLNKEYLNHDTYTDIITFDYGEKKGMINGEIYISIDRVKANAKEFKIYFINELHRVMIHGILHLCGYKDKTLKLQKDMRAKEDFYLSRLILQ
jgi:rRNA maturation RNase YbeY